MRGLTAIEREMLEDSVGVCSGRGGFVPWTNEEELADKELVKRGLVVGYVCELCSNCEEIAMHNEITSDGLLMLRIDSMVKV
jgi:hypothetical protein